MYHPPVFLFQSPKLLGAFLDYTRSNFRQLFFVYNRSENVAALPQTNFLLITHSKKSLQQKVATQPLSASEQPAQFLQISLNARDASNSLVPLFVVSSQCVRISQHTIALVIARSTGMYAVQTSDTQKVVVYTRIPTFIFCAAKVQSARYSTIEVETFFLLPQTVRPQKKTLPLLNPRNISIYNQLRRRSCVTKKGC
jgi:hypothetical protein